MGRFFPINQLTALFLSRFVFFIGDVFFPTEPAIEV